MSNTSLLRYLVDESGSKLLTEVQIHLLEILIDLANGSNSCTPSVTKLQNELEVEERRVRFLLKSLKDMGLVRVQKRKTGNNTFLPSIYDLTTILILLDEEKERRDKELSEKGMVKKPVRLRAKPEPNPEVSTAHIHAEVDPTDKLLIRKEDLYTEEMHKKIMEEAYKRNLEEIRLRAMEPKPMTRAEQYLGVRWSEQPPEVIEKIRMTIEENRRKDSEELEQEKLKEASALTSGQ